MRAQIFQLPLPIAANTGVVPNIKTMTVFDTQTLLTTPGYLNSISLESFPVSTNDFILINYGYNQVNQTSVGQMWCSVSINSMGIITLVPAPSVSTNLPAPGTIRAIIGTVNETAPIMTSGNLVGVRGVINYVGASGGFLYGIQGKLIPTGTLSGSSWNAAVFGQFDVSHAIINGGQLATVWGDWGATGATATSMTGARGYAFTNTTSNVLNAQFYMYGPATNWFELDDNSGAYGSSYITSGGTGALSGTIKKLAITINGVTYYLPCATTIS